MYVCVRYHSMNILLRLILYIVYFENAEMLSHRTYRMKVIFPIYLIPSRKLDCLGKFMSSMYFLIFGILQDFTPKMLEIAFQGL